MLFKSVNGKCQIHVFLALILASSIFGQDFSVPGPYAAGWREVTVARPNSSTFGALLYYPAQASTENAPISQSAGPCPAVSFGHGFLVSPDKYRSTFAHLASWGYVVIASRSENGLLPNQQNFAYDLQSS